MNGTIDVREPIGSRLPEFLENLAQLTNGWSGERVFESHENDFAVRASCDQLGHIRFRVELKESLYDDAWQVSATVRCDLGELTDIARAIRAAWHGAA